VDRLADKARGVDVFEQRRIVWPKARKTRARGMRADRRAVNAAAQISQIVVTRAGEGRCLKGEQFAVALGQGDKGIGIGQGAGEELALAL
jgi:hypothetical protein